jgi:hypothetical protein
MPAIPRGEARLEALPRPGQPVVIPAAHRCQLLAFACEHSISHGTGAHMSLRHAVTGDRTAHLIWSWLTPPTDEQRAGAVKGPEAAMREQGNDEPVRRAFVSPEPCGSGVCSHPHSTCDCSTSAHGGRD